MTFKRQIGPEYLCNLPCKLLVHVWPTHGQLLRLCPQSHAAQAKLLQLCVQDAKSQKRRRPARLRPCLTRLRAQSTILKMRQPSRFVQVGSFVGACQGVDAEPNGTEAISRVVSSARRFVGVVANSCEGHGLYLPRAMARTLLDRVRYRRSHRRPCCRRSIESSFLPRT